MRDRGGRRDWKRDKKIEREGTVWVEGWATNFITAIKHHMCEMATERVASNAPHDKPLLMHTRVQCIMQRRQLMHTEMLSLLSNSR